MIRIMENKDIPYVVDLEKECFSMPWSEESIAKETENKDSLFCVCEADEKVIGYAGMYYVYPEGDITNVAITKDYRGHGYAKKLLKYMFEKASEAGVSEFTLEVRVSNLAAIRLYESLGFENAGIRKKFYDNPKEDAYIMWKR